jgi:hypothetical protein
MRIDQRNAGASVTPTDGQYTLDRFRCFRSQSSKYTVQQNAGSVTPPTGFTNYLGVTSTSAYSSISTDYFAVTQFIEGFNVSDLAWGTANAATVTLSFWVRSSLTGTFGGNLTNSAGNRTYCYSYTISSANTWEKKTITILGDTTGTWLTNNSTGVRLWFDLGSGSDAIGAAGSWGTASIARPTGATSVVGTNGATFYITGVQLEKGSTATSFDYRPYGTELDLCQRYCQRIDSSANAYAPYGMIYVDTSSVAYSIMSLCTPMRGTISLTTTGTASNYAVAIGAVITACNAVPSFNSNSQNSVSVVAAVAGTPLTVGRAGALVSNNTTASYLIFTSEL